MRGSIDLFWIPLGAGGVGFVRFNGRAYEAIKARREHRAPKPLYHSALQVTTEDGRYVIENAWPSPNRRIEERGVVVEGPVFSPWLGGLRSFRYEVRCWRDGVIPDAGAAGDPVHLTDDLTKARLLLELAPSLPPHVWGRDELGSGEMWNSNSAVSWLLARAGLPMESIRPPRGGRAPGWQSGIRAAVAHGPRWPSG